MPVVATAGHVDHGKSTLVRALTGRDPDRWEEEKRRGLTIDLGFAWATLDGLEVSFVDVPGHERFVKNMLAGTEGMDLALFVVAADEGWMPQSEEHMSVLDLLGVDRGVVAITKADRVDADHLELVVLDVEDRLQGTSLSEAPLVVTSVTEQTGIDELRAALAKVVSDSPTSSPAGRPKLWIDRAFTISGAGTIVTGTLTGGSLEVNQPVEILPAGRKARIRSLQSHEQVRTEVQAGSRTAVNLAAVDLEDVKRGMLLAPPGQWALTKRIVARLRTVRALAEPLTSRGAYHLHLGTGSWPARLRLLETVVLEGTGAALVELDGPIPVAVGDSFILREVGRRAVVAGGRVLNPEAPARTREARDSLGELERILELPPDDQATLLLELRGTASLSTLAAHTGGGQPSATVVAGDQALSGEASSRITRSASEVVAAFHRENPLRPGISKASLASGLGVNPEVLEAVVADSPDLVDDGAQISVRGFEGALSDEQEAVASQVEERIRAAGLAVPRAAELSVDEELLHSLVRSGRLVRISDDLLYLPEQLAAIRSSLDELPKPFTVAEFRDELTISRKYAVPLLEWLDSQGVTLRRGDTRTLRQS